MGGPLYRAHAVNVARQIAAVWQLRCDLDGRYRWYVGERMPTQLAAPTPEAAIELLTAHTRQRWSDCTLQLELLPRASE